MLVGDAIFEGGPGKTWSPKDFRTALDTLRRVIAAWPDETRCYPGHGGPFRIGDIRWSTISSRTTFSLQTATIRSMMF